MNNKVLIRQGQRTDIPHVMRLVRELAEYERAPHEVTNTEEEMLRDGFGENPSFGFYVAELDHNVVGLALYYTRYSTWKGRCFYLEDIVVSEQYRGLGIGHQLFMSCLKNASDNGFASVNWQVLDWNEPAIRFYDRYNAEKDGEWINCRIMRSAFADLLDQTDVKS